jgi:hypothetical protein
MQSRLRVVIVAFLSALMLLQPEERARAQSDTALRQAVLRGDVRGPNQQPIVSAQVSVLGGGRSDTTNERGEFSLDGLRRGTQIVEVVAPGFATRRLPVVLSESTPFLAVWLERATPVLDSVRVVADRLELTEKRGDRITEAELSDPSVASGSAYDAVQLLRPQYLMARLPTSAQPTNGASQRGQMYFRDATTKEAAGGMTVSVNEGPPGSIDMLKTVAVRTIREMRYLAPLDATARFGVTSDGGPVLVIYTR